MATKYRDVLKEFAKRSTFVQGSVVDYAQAYKKLGPPEQAVVTTKVDTESGKLTVEASRSYGDYYDTAGGHAKRVSAAMAEAKANREAIYAHPISPATLREAKARALKKLWDGVFSSIVVRHPNGVIHFVTEGLGGSYYYEQSAAVHGKIRLGIPDTRHDVRKPYNNHINFHTPIKLNEWPGEKLAGAWVTAAYMIYMAHEASELVHYKAKVRGGKDFDQSSHWEGHYFPYPGTSRVFDVHALDDYNAKNHHWEAFDHLANGDLWAILKTLMGEKALKNKRECAEAPAARQLKEAIDEELSKYDSSWSTFPKSYDQYNFHQLYQYKTELANAT